MSLIFGIRLNQQHIELHYETTSRRLQSADQLQQIRRLRAALLQRSIDPVT